MIFCAIPFFANVTPFLSPYLKSFLKKHRHIIPCQIYVLLPTLYQILHDLPHLIKGIWTIGVIAKAQMELTNSQQFFIIEMIRITGITTNFNTSHNAIFNIKKRLTTPWRIWEKEE